MAQPSVIVYSANDVDNVPQLADNQTFTGTNTFSGAVVLNGSLSGTSIKDEDAMTSDSATAVPTQQSVKAYADTKLALSGGTITGNVSMGANTLTAHSIKADASDGVLIEAGNGTDVAILGAGNTANALFYGGVNVTGDLTIAGDDLFMTTNTANYTLIADGTNYNPTSPADARTALGLVIGTNIQAYDADTLTASNTKTLTNKTVQDLKITTVSKTADYTTSTTESIILVTPPGIGDVTITLPSSASGRVYTIKRQTSGGGNVIVAATIDGAASKTITTNYGFITVVGDGSNYFIIASGGTIS